MNTRILFSFTGALAAFLLAPLAHAQVTVALYGDDDGFGVGQTSGILASPLSSHADVGEAPFTDIPLIGNSSNFTGPAFTPTGGFTFSLPAGSTITQAVLTLRTGSFVSGPSPVDGTNQIFLDGLLVSSAFINGFSSLGGDGIETRSVVLDNSFFALLADGSVSLNGTHLSENNGAGSFQVDFLKLEVTTTPGIVAVPEPSTYGLIGAAVLLGLVATRRIRTRSFASAK